MFCQKCGTELPDGSAFCASCGAQQGEVQQPVVAPIPQGQFGYAQKHDIPMCTCCGYVGEWKVGPVLKGRHWVIGIILLFLGVVPGIIYLTTAAIVRSGKGNREKICKQCGAKNLFTFFY